MSTTLFIIDGRFPGNTMCDPDETSHDEQLIHLKNIHSLQEFCDKMKDVFEQFNDASNFETEIATIASQLEVNNFAKIQFDYPSARYYVTIVPPKFENGKSQETDQQ